MKPKRLGFGELPGRGRMETGRAESSGVREAPALCRGLSARPRLPAVSELRPFPGNGRSSEQNGPPSSLSHGDKAVKPQEGSPEPPPSSSPVRSAGLAMASVVRSPRPARPDALLGGERGSRMAGQPAGVRELVRGVGTLPPSWPPLRRGGMRAGGTGRPPPARGSRAPSRVQAQTASWGVGRRGVLLPLLALRKAWESGCLALPLLPIRPGTGRGAAVLGGPVACLPCPYSPPRRLASAAGISGSALQLLARCSPCEAQGGGQERGEKPGAPFPPPHPASPLLGDSRQGPRFPGEGPVRQVPLPLASHALVPRPCSDPQSGWN